jgi:hypothetical protein
LLQEVEVKVLIRKRWGEIEVSIDEGLRACIEESINVCLVPTVVGLAPPPCDGGANPVPVQLVEIWSTNYLTIDAHSLD